MNQMIRDCLNELTRVDDMESVVAALDGMWATESYRSAAPWTREELHERS